MAKTLPVRSNGETIGYMIECPACGCGHLFYTNHPDKKHDHNWTFDGNLDSPTFSPSMLVYPSHNQKRCHSFVRNGKIQFLNDCGHQMAGQTVELPDMDGEEC